MNQLSSTEKGTTKGRRTTGLVLLAFLPLAVCVVLLLSKRSSAPELPVTSGPAVSNLGSSATTNALTCLQITTKFFELSDFNPASEPQGSPLRILPLKPL